MKENPVKRTHSGRLGKYSAKPKEQLRYPFLNTLLWYRNISFAFRVVAQVCHNLFRLCGCSYSFVSPSPLFPLVGDKAGALTD